MKEVRRKALCICIKPVNRSRLSVRRDGVNQDYEVCVLPGFKQFRSFATHFNNGHAG
jgi:hypothetical protein